MSFWNRRKPAPVEHPEPVEVRQPSAGLWAEDGVVNIVLEDAEIVEFKGRLTPGVGLTPAGAMKLAENLLAVARTALEQIEDR